MAETHRHTTRISAEHAGKRLDQALAAIFSQYSRSAIKQWIKAGHVTCNQNRLRPRDLVAVDDEIEMLATLDASENLSPAPVEFSEKFADDDLIVVDKPAGCVVHPGAGNRENTLANGLLNRYPELIALPRAGLIHRLDKNTSGLLLVARTTMSFQLLTRQMARREISRKYDAVVNGTVIAGGTIDEPIGRDPKNRLKMAVRSTGRRAVSHYRVIEKFRAHTYLEVQLETGRTHQIRVHLSHLGFPIIGDKRYGARMILPQSPHDRLNAALSSFDRHALHAKSLQFIHPLSADEIHVESELPGDIAEILAAANLDRQSDDNRG